MLFNSTHFFDFFCVVLPLSFVVPARFKWVFLLLASLYFYLFSNPLHILILLFEALAVYGLVHQMVKRDKVHQKPFLITAIVLSVSILGFFKYAGFLNSILGDIFSVFHGTWTFAPQEWALPLGISFYTFQCISYSVEVYRGNYPPEKHFGYFLLYLLFWPHLIAGPIQRPRELLPQLKVAPQFSSDDLFLGLKWMLRGYFKKVVIADRLVRVVQPAFQNPSSYDGLGLALATLFFTIQIYCDFSGYCDIAIGAARCMGYRLSQNFNYPYFASSFQDFWKRWHITLSTWFRDYVYIPLGGNRCSRPRHFFNIVVTFAISGLWHGASWHFVFWGFLNGFFVALESLLAPAVSKISTTARAILKVPYALLALFLVNMTWIFFRAHNLNDAFFILKQIATHHKYPFNELVSNFIFLSSRTIFILTREMTICYSLIALLLVTELIGRLAKISIERIPLPAPIRIGVYSALVWGILLLGNLSIPRTFIYFQF